MNLSIRPANFNTTTRATSDIIRLFDANTERKSGKKYWKMNAEEWKEFTRITHTKSLAAFADWVEYYSQLSEDEKRHILRENATYLSVVRDE